MRTQSKGSGRGSASKSGNYPATVRNNGKSPIGRTKENAEERITMEGGDCIGGNE